MYEYEALNLSKSFEEGGGERWRIMEGMNQTRVQYMYIWKITINPPVRLPYTNKNIEKEIHKMDKL
jgi:hypothetical protein